MGKKDVERQVQFEPAADGGVDQVQGREPLQTPLGLFVQARAMYRVAGDLGERREQAYLSGRHLAWKLDGDEQHAHDFLSRTNGEAGAAPADRDLRPQSLAGAHGLGKLTCHKRFTGCQNMLYDSLAEECRIAAELAEPPATYGFS